MSDEQDPGGTGGPKELRCESCGAVIQQDHAVRQGQVERVGCHRCGLQLIRRTGQSWQAIRG